MATGSRRGFAKTAWANAVIGGYIEIAREKGIRVSASIRLPENISIDRYELCTLFGNTIENAIEACERIPQDSELYEKRHIDIAARDEKGRLVLRVENSFSGLVQTEGGGFLSSKGSGGGVGLQSVRAVVERHDGCLSCEQRDGSFVLSALLCLHSASGAASASGKAGLALEGGE